MVLTSSRAQPNSHLDFLSDYDVELFVSRLDPFSRDDAWLEAFGSILVRWPYRPRPTGVGSAITRLVLFSDGVRIDFQIDEVAAFDPSGYDDGYRVLVDKDGTTAGIPEPTFSQYVIREPSREAFESVAHEFWWDATYVPKYLWRDELPFAKYMLDTVMRHEYLHPMLEWYVGLQNRWNVETGIHGKRFKRYLDGSTWAEYEATCAGAGLAENWNAFYAMLQLFSWVARSVAQALGFDYPVELDREVTAYCRRIQSTPQPASGEAGRA